MVAACRDIEVVGLAGNGREAAELSRRLRPDVVLMDVSMPRVSGVEATREILAECPTAKVVACSTHHSPDVARGMLDAGAVAYLTKGGPIDEVLKAIRSAAGGNASGQLSGAAVAGELTDVTAHAIRTGQGNSA